MASGNFPRMDSKILTRLVVLFGCSTLFLLGVLVGGMVNRPLDVGAQSRVKFRELRGVPFDASITKLLQDGWEPFSVDNSWVYLRR